MSVITSSPMSVVRTLMNSVQNADNPLLKDKEKLSNIIKKGPSNNEQEYRDAMDMIFSDENEGFREDFFSDKDVARRVLKAVLREECAITGGVSAHDSRLLQIVFNENWQPQLSDKDVARLNNEFFKNGSFRGDPINILVNDYANFVHRLGLDYHVSIAEEIGGFSSIERQFIANYVDSEDELRLDDGNGYAGEPISTAIGEPLWADSLETLEGLHQELGLTGERINAHGS